MKLKNLASLHPNYIGIVLGQYPASFMTIAIKLFLKKKDNQKSNAHNSQSKLKPQKSKCAKKQHTQQLNRKPLKKNKKTPKCQQQTQPRDVKKPNNICFFKLNPLY